MIPLLQAARIQVQSKACKSRRKQYLELLFATKNFPFPPPVTDLGDELRLPLVLHPPRVGGHHLGDHREVSVVAPAHDSEVEDPVLPGDQRDLLELLGPVGLLPEDGGPGVPPRLLLAGLLMTTGGHWSSLGLPQHSDAGLSLTFVTLLLSSKKMLTWSLCVLLISLTTSHNSPLLAGNHWLQGITQ